MASDPIEFRAAARSDVGLVRSNNQDSGYASTNLLILADGMGGPAGGDIASSVAIAHLVPLDADSHAAESMLPLLREALTSAHEELSERSTLDPELAGLGTTCIALMRSGNRLAMVHIGDSRAYLLRGDTLTQVTTDHSLVQYLVDTGKITPEEAEHHPKRNVVLKVLGDADMDITPDETVREAVVGDRWLLCSDGLSGVVSSETIGTILATIEDPGQCAEELIRLALLAGGPDNITCVIADVVPAGAYPSAAPQVVGAAARDRNAASRGGSGAAARAAALSLHQPDPHDTDDNEDEPAPSTGRTWLRFVVPAIITGLIIALGWLGWAWSQSQYYAIGEDGRVVIHQGIPQSIGSWSFSHSVEVTNIALADLPPVDRQRLTEPVVRSSREEIDAYIAQLASSIALRQFTSEADASQSGQSAAQSGASSTAGGSS